MVNNGNRRSRRRATARTRAAPKIKRVVQRLEHGTRFVPSSDPPNWTQAPWWPLTLVSHESSPTLYSGAILHEGICISLGIPKLPDQARAIKFNIRLITVRAWGLAKQAFTLDVYDEFGDNRKLAQLADMGSPIHYSRLGWRFGLTAVANTIDPDSKTVLFNVDGDITSTSKVMVYIQLLVQVSGVPAAKIPLKSLVSSQPAVPMDLAGEFEVLSTSH